MDHACGHLHEAVAVQHKVLRCGHSQERAHHAQLHSFPIALAAFRDQQDNLHCTKHPSQILLSSSHLRYKDLHRDNLGNVLGQCAAGMHSIWQAGGCYKDDWMVLPLVQRCCRHPSVRLGCSLHASMHELPAQSTQKKFLNALHGIRTWHAWCTTPGR